MCAENSIHEEFFYTQDHKKARVHGGNTNTGAFLIARIL